MRTAPSVEPLERSQVTATDYALNEVRALLIGGALAPGSRIDQADLAKRFGVSIVPIREALARLQSVGLVEIVPHRGVFVASVAAEELVDIYTVREILEEQAARIAVRKLTDADLESLRGLSAAMSAAAKSKDYESLLRRNREFHFVIYRAAGRRHMLQIIERLWDLSARYARLQLQAVPERPAESMFEARRIVHACERRDADALALMVRYKVHQATVELLERAELSGGVAAPSPVTLAVPARKAAAQKGRRGSRLVSR